MSSLVTAKVRTTSSCVCTNIVLCMYVGLLSGVVVDIGYDSTSVSAVKEGIVLKTATLSVGGLHVDKELATLLNRGTVDQACLSTIKEHYCYVAENVQEDMKL